MSLGKELLLSCIAIMHISSMISQPVKRHTDYLHPVLVLSLGNLKIAEENYVKYMFDRDQPQRDELLPLEGITKPLGNTTEENQTSMCTIIDYLDNHVPNIIRSTLNEHTEDLIPNIRAFNTQFKKIGQNKACVPKSNNTTSDDYTKKVNGYRMIYFARDWVEQYINTIAASS